MKGSKDIPLAPAQRQGETKEEHSRRLTRFYHEQRKAARAEEREKRSARRAARAARAKATADKDETEWDEPGCLIEYEMGVPPGGSIVQRWIKSEDLVELNEREIAFTVVKGVLPPYPDDARPAFSIEDVD